jgi:hypothetical protein
VFDTSVIPELFKDVLNEEVVTFEKAENPGVPHVTYIIGLKSGKKLFFRANLGGGKPEVTLVTEKLISELTTKNNIASNKIIYVDITRKKYPFDFQIQELIHGLDAELIFEGSEEDYNKFSFSIGQNIAKMSEIRFKGFGHFKEDEVLKGNLVGEDGQFSEYINIELDSQIEMIFKNELINQSQKQFIEKLFADSKEMFDVNEGGLVHYDLADHNIRYNPETYEVEALFDWEAAVIGDSMLDIGSSPTWRTLFPREEKLVEGYKSIKQLPDDNKERINIYRLRTVIWKMCHSIVHGILNPERRARMGKALEVYGV